MKLLVLFLGIEMVAFTSCLSTEKPRRNFLSMLNRTDARSDDRLNFNGGYQQVQSDSMQAIKNLSGAPNREVNAPYLVKPLFFFTNGLVLHALLAYPDSNSFVNWLTGNSALKWSLNNWGVYEIRHDTIKAILYVDLYWTYFRRRQLTQCYYEGLLKNRDTILQWRMVPPYPEKAVKNEMNEWELKNEMTPKNLYFKQVPQKGILDSSKAWINEFRKK